MQKVDEQKLENDTQYRFDYLRQFMNFGAEDIAAIRGVLGQLARQVPSIVEETYDTMLHYDATARHFLEQQSGHDTLPAGSLAELSQQDAQVKFRKDHLQRYLMNVLGHSFDGKFAILLDTVGKMHTPDAGNPKINVPLVQMNAFMGMLSDLLTRRVVALDLDDAKKMAAVRALHKILWLQNDFISRHYTGRPAS